MKTYLHYLAHKLAKDWRENWADNLSIACFVSGVFLIPLGLTIAFVAPLPYGLLVTISGLLLFMLPIWLYDHIKNSYRSYQEWKCTTSTETVGDEKK